jgi:thiol-disulfide isomerase/thioredoxin
MRRASLGIGGHIAPEWEVSEWFGLPHDQARLRLEDITSPVVYLYCFQSWCPGCHSHGFPTMAAVRAQVPEEGVAFVAVQTVFEGHEVNTAERAVASVEQHGLGEIAVGHDVDPLGGPPSMMRLYRTGGTPWTVIIGPERRVCFDGFQIDEASAVAIIGQLLR